jgi:hypothetical protein
MAIVVDRANAGTAVDDSGATTIAVNTTQTVAAGGFIVASVGWWHGSATLSSVGGGGLSWSIAVQGKNSIANPASAIVWAQAPSGLASGTAITATFSTSVNGRQIGVTSFTGVATSSPVDTTTAVASSSTTAWTNNATIAAGSVLIVTAHLDPSANSTITSPSIEALDWNDTANTAMTTGYRIEASGGSYTVAGTWVTGATVRTATVAAAFIADAGGGGGATVKQLAALGVG